MYLEGVGACVRKSKYCFLINGVRKEDKSHEDEKTVNNGLGHCY